MGLHYRPDSFILSSLFFCIFIFFTMPAKRKGSRGKKSTESMEVETIVNSSQEESSQDSLETEHAEIAQLNAMDEDTDEEMENNLESGIENDVESNLIAKDVNEDNIRSSIEEELEDTVEYKVENNIEDTCD